MTTRTPVEKPPAPEERPLPASFPVIWQVIAAIPAGQVSSYGEVAARAGLPGRARLVAQALRAVPPGLELPWYRVLRSGGRIAFPVDSEPFRRQRRKLQAEGVDVDERGRVRRQRHAADHGDDLDAALWRM